MNDILLEFEIGPKSITESDDVFNFEGLAIYENAMSGNHRFYPAEFIDESIQRTEDWHSLGHVTTIHKSHYAAYMGEMPLGKAPRLEHKDGAMRFIGEISKTTDGENMIKLVRNGVIARMSIRSSQFEFDTVKMETDEGKQPVDLMRWAVIEGIDFCERPGITGAGITRILESAPTWAQKENNMEWSEVTLETLRENRADLLEGYLRESIGAFLTESGDLKERLTAKEAEVEAKVAELAAVDKTEEITSLTEKAAALVEAQSVLDWKVKRFESAAPQWLTALVEELDQCDPNELVAQAKEKRDEIIARFTSPEPKGKGEQVDEDDEVDVPSADGLVDESTIRNTRS